MANCRDWLIWNYVIINFFSRLGAYIKTEVLLCRDRIID